MRLWLAATCLCLSAPALTDTGPWRASYTDWEKDQPERRAYKLGYQYRNNEHLRDYQYIHQPLLIRTGDPGHNGYFHQFDARHGYALDNLWIEAQLGVHGSSNIFKYQRFHRQALVTTFHAHWTPDAGPSAVGINGDYRFGGFKVYPHLRLERELPGATELVLELPIGVHWRAANQRWQLGFERYGEKWGALDSERELKTATYLREWRLQALWRAPLQGRLSAQVHMGVSFDSRFRQYDLAEGWQTLNLDDASYLGFGFNW
ncbi:hypothetical protein [Marinimicrobium alkaliphilum]|uniref:hypothetical protein n=1 Tax=Marinimicrobium alkaliphilum TaxID=2202654 RepID=UPI000DBA1A7F|nr:hypothetical protein [Marinimicrobium alkaliphilum]